MDSPFPGMDPYLEHPALWPDVHNSLIAAIRDALVPLVAPRYYVALERRTYLLTPDDLVLIGRPDVALVHAGGPATGLAPSLAGPGVLEVDVPMADETGEDYLEVHEVHTGRLVTIVELLSPVNKLHTQGRRQYEAKRGQIFQTLTNMVEIDLLRAGNPMAVVGRAVRSDYRILVSRGAERPRAQLYPFGVMDAIPTIGVPLLPGETEPTVALGDVVHDVYRRARLDLRLDYDQPPVPPLPADAQAWARQRVRAVGGRTPPAEQFPTT